MKLSVIIVTWNAGAFIEECLDSLDVALAQVPGLHETIVVDNGSTDDTRTRVRKAHRVNLIANAENRGFAAANNQAAALARGERLLFLNPDTRPSPDAIRLLLESLAARADQGCGAVCPSLRYEDGAFQDSAFHFPSLSSMALDTWMVHPRLSATRLNGRYPRERYAAPFQADFALGACFLVTRQAWDAVGPWDEGFFLYYEEVDWFRRLAANGLTLWCIPGAVVTHLAGASTGQQAPRSWQLLQESKRRYFRKHHSALEAGTVDTLVAAAAARRLGEAKRKARAGELDAAGLAAWDAACRAVVHGR